MCGLGDQDGSTAKAISFMRDEVLNLQHFDKLCAMKGILKGG